MTCIAGIIALFVFCSGMFNTIPGTIVAYFMINALYAPFNILLGSELQRVIPSQRRATMLSISNQLDDLFSVLTDPFIGMGIDRLGFGMVYQFVGALTFVIIITAFVLIRRIKAPDSEEAE